MKICIIAPEFYPSKGGIGKTFTYMCKAFKTRKEKLYFFNRFYKGENIYDILDRAKKYKLRDLSIIFKNQTHFFYFLLSVWKILSAKQVKFNIRLNMLLYICIKPNVLIKLVRNISSIYPLLKKIKPDLIFGCTCGSVVLPLGFILSRLVKKKFICSAHGTDFLVQSHYSLKTHYLKVVDKIILHSDKLKDLIKRINHLKDKQLVIIPPGLYLQNYNINSEKNQIRKEFNIRSEDFILISVGRQVPRKNFQIVIKAIKIIKEKYPHSQIKYFLIGKGAETQNLKEMRKNFNLKKEITFLGFLNDDMKNKYMKASDVFIMPSITLKNSIEGFGLVYLEAYFYKLPSIGTMTGGISEAIEHDKSGLLLKPNDLNGLVNAIIYLFDHEKERKVMGEYGYKLIMDKYNWGLLVHNYIEVFKEFLI